MPTYSTHQRFSRIQQESEERKHQAHLKKISEMHSHSSVDHSSPRRYPHIHDAFVKHLSDKRLEIDRENEIKSRKLIDIMQTKNAHSPPPTHRSNQTNHSTQTTHRNHNKKDLSQDNTEYFERVAKAKGKYDTQEWKKDYELHQERLKLRKNNSVFTPINTGPKHHSNTKTNSTSNSRQTVAT
ncbi:unnamed protein product [Adineta steineri]|uniref:Uncharacterized protein n=1 Tax=Adineta steineri TaxID=433720 RepID=A0A813WFG0_9BILA|nr:unnamed protein product [Adineta steineri]